VIYPAFLTFRSRHLYRIEPKIDRTSKEDIAETKSTTKRDSPFVAARRGPVKTIMTFCVCLERSNPTLLEYTYRLTCIRSYASKRYYLKHKESRVSKSSNFWGTVISFEIHCHNNARWRRPMPVVAAHRRLQLRKRWRRPGTRLWRIALVFSSLTRCLGIEMLACCSLSKSGSAKLQLIGDGRPPLNSQLHVVGDNQKVAEGAKDGPERVSGQ